MEGSRRVWRRREGCEGDRPRFHLLARLVVRVARVEGYLAHLDKTSSGKKDFLKIAVGVYLL